MLTEITHQPEEHLESQSLFVQGFMLTWQFAAINGVAQSQSLFVQGFMLTSRRCDECL